MTNYKFILAVLFLGLFWSCNPPVVFSEPQPQGVDALTRIPEQFQGSYWCDMDSVNLYIDTHIIYKSKLVAVELAKADLNNTTEASYENGRLFLKGLNESVPATEKDGVIYSTLNLKDTLFSNKLPTQVLKYFKGHLVLNNKLDDNQWNVQIMTLKPSGALAISKVDYPDNLTDLETITPVKIINSRKREQILIAPTKAEFDEILDKNVVFTGSCQEFRPIIPL